jgi:hypothetical protein
LVGAETDGRIALDPIWRAMIGLAMALVMAAVPAAAWADHEPDITTAPALSGSPLVGAQLDAVGATWTGQPTIFVRWLWVRCDSEDWQTCELIEGAITPSYVVTGDDLGKRLRVVLGINSRHGSDWAASELSVPVATPPPPPPVVVLPSPVVPPPPAVAAPPRRMRPAPVIRIRGWLTRRGARITLLTVRAPRRARISVRCSGIGCPRAAPAQAAKLTRLRTYEGMYRAGARIVVRVTREGFVGKHTAIRIRRGKAPLRRDRCLFPGSPRPSRCPAG